MPIYKYKFLKDGVETDETKDFSGKESLYAYIRSNNASVISVEEIKSGKASFFSFSFRKRVKSQEVITFARNLSVMIDAGVPVSRALSILARQSKNKNLVSILEGMNKSVTEGQTLSKSMKEYPKIFSGLFVSMVKAGEESGKLSYSLKVVADQLEKSYGLSKKIKGAMIYPAVIVSIMIIIGVLMMVYMVPTLTETFKGLNIELPFITRIIISISDFLRYNIILVLAAAVVLFLGFTTLIKTKKGKDFVDFLSLHTPIIGTMTREVNAARTARTLSSLVSSGVDIVSAINITSDVLQNHYFKNILNTAAKRVEVGETLSATLIEKNSLYPVFVGEMLAVGEETGKMTDMMVNVANYYENEVDQKTKDLSTVIEPFIMVLIGLAVGVFAAAMMLPTYSLVDAIQ